MSSVLQIVAICFLLCALCQLGRGNHLSSFCYQTGEVGLRNGPSSREGRVDICRDGFWYSACNDTWKLSDTQLVCRELGFCEQGGSQTSDQWYQTFIPWDFTQVNCSGNETELSFCNMLSPSSSCYSNYVAAGVNCSAEVPNQPINPMIQTDIDSYMIQLSWTPPNMTGCTDVDEYSINCIDQTDYVCHYIFSFPMVTTNSTSLNITHFDYFYCNFTCCISGNNQAGEGAQSCIGRPPPTPPRNVTVLPVSDSLTSLLVEWTESENLNGRLDFYRVTCGTYSTNAYSPTTITGLSPHTTYTCCVSASIYTYRYNIESAANCNNGTTYTEPPSAPDDVFITEITATTLQLQWSTPEYNGTLLHYTVTCTQSNTIVWSSTTANNTEIVTMLQPFTGYTCCVSATNEGGEGNSSCIDTRTLSAPPSEPQDITTVVTETTSLTLSWIEPAESYGQAVQSYAISCNSAQHNVTLEVYNTSVQVDNLISGTNYTCCIWAVNVVGFGDVRCIQVSTNTIVERPEVNNQGILVAAVSGGALLAVLALLVIIITVAVCCCYHRKCSSKQQTENKQSTDEVIYDIPEGGLELKETTSTVNNTDPHPRNHNYKEEVEIRYEKPVLNSATKADQRKKKPMTPRKPQANKGGKSPADVTCSTQGTQPSAEKVYQPLIPPKTYKGPEASSEYQGLTFGGENKVADNSEGQYEPIRKPQEREEQEEGNQYEPLTFGGGNTQPQAEGVYQALTKREEPNTYQDLRSVRT